MTMRRPISPRAEESVANSGYGAAKRISAGIR